MLIYIRNYHFTACLLMTMNDPKSYSESTKTYRLLPKANQSLSELEFTRQKFIYTNKLTKIRW